MANIIDPKLLVEDQVLWMIPDRLPPTRQLAIYRATVYQATPHSLVVVIPALSGAKPRRYRGQGLANFFTTEVEAWHTLASRINEAVETKHLELERLLALHAVAASASACHGGAVAIPEPIIPEEDDGGDGGEFESMVVFKPAQPTSKFKSS